MASVKERGSWASKTEFILSCLGYAIGLGNVWRFPYLCYRNGGGAFLVPYLTMLFFCGIPLFFLEICIGQFSGRGCVTVFNIAPLLKGAGLTIVVINFICTSYYNVIIAYPILFLWKSLRSQLPWESCDNEWNTDRCLELSGPNKADILMNNSMLSPVERWRTPADEFFHNEILHISDGIESPGSIVWPLFLCNVIAWMVIYACIINGVKSVGKVVYFTATFPFVVMGILFIRGITLPGAMEGIRFYILPQWSQLTNLKVWADAAIQIFFSLGPGWGGIVNMASYNQFKNNTKMDSILIPIVNCGTSIFAGFVVFSVLGYLSHQTGLPVSTVATGGPGLAFITYPEAIAMLPFPQLWASLFFTMLFFLGVDSMFVQIEAIISSVLDEFPLLRRRKRLITLGTCFIMFLLSTACTTEFVQIEAIISAVLDELPWLRKRNRVFTLGTCMVLFILSTSCTTEGGMYLLQLFDWYSASISVILVCIVEVVAVAWIYGVQNFVRDVEFMIDRTVDRFWIVSWKFITPAILSFIFVTTILYNTEVTYNGVRYPKWAIAVGWMSCISSMLCIPAYALYKIFSSKGSLLERIKSNLTPRDWGPADELQRSLWQSHVEMNSTK